MLYCGLSGVGVCLVNATAQQVRGHLADQGGVRESVSISLCTHTVNVCGCNAGSEKAHAGTRGVCNNTGGTPQEQHALVLLHFYIVVSSVCSKLHQACINRFNEVI